VAKGVRGFPGDMTSNIRRRWKREGGIEEKEKEVDRLAFLFERRERERWWREAEKHIQATNEDKENERTELAGVRRIFDSDRLEQSIVAA
jgi:hypothetical protein